MNYTHPCEYCSTTKIPSSNQFYCQQKQLIDFTANNLPHSNTNYCPTATYKSALLASGHAFPPSASGDNVDANDYFSIKINDVSALTSLA